GPARVYRRPLFQDPAGRRHADAAGGDELSGHQGRDVRAARSHLQRVFHSQSETRSGQHDLAPANQSAVHRGLSRGLEPRVCPRAALARISDDQRGSYFRQFWDASTYVDREQRDPKTLAEYLKDIPPLHQWLVTSALGSPDP